MDLGVERTLGIITKPGFLFAGSESERRFPELAENKDIYFRHCWYVLRNRDYDIHNTSIIERNWIGPISLRREWETIVEKPDWSYFPEIEISKIIESQILTKLPSLVKDVISGI